MAQEKAIEGHIRLNGERVEKPSAAVHVGDIMTLPAAGKVVSLKVLALGSRRGPVLEARSLYQLIAE